MYNCKIILFCVLFSLVACDSKKTKASETQNSTEMSSIDLSKEFNEITSGENDKRVLAQIIHQFDKGMCKGSKDRSINECYELNAISIRSDVFQSIPYTLNYPYNNKFNLSMFENVDALQFLTKLCGFDNGAGKTINFYCLKSESKLIEYFSNIKKESSIIKRFVKTYKEQKTITPALRKDITMNALEDLDFNEPGHRLFYMIFHIMSNEERIAGEKIK